MHILNFFLFLVFLTSTLQASFIERSYCTLLGDEDASEPYQATIRTALQQFKVPDAATVPIKKMNSVAPSIFGYSLYSFTAFGIWINEDLLDQLHGDQEVEKLFTLYHEAAHYARNHHQQLLWHLAPTPFIVGAALYLGNSMVTRTAAKIAVALTISGISAALIDRALIRPLIRTQEAEADIDAALLLRAQGKNQIVDGFVATLKQLSIHGFGDHTDGWHPTIDETINNIEQSQQGI